MASISALQTSSASVAAGLLRAAEDNTGVVVTLLKKVTDSDKDLVRTLLPPPGASGSVNIAA